MGPIWSPRDPSETAEQETVQRRRADLERQRNEEYRRSVDEAAKLLHFDE